MSDAVVKINLSDTFDSMASMNAKRHPKCKGRQHYNYDYIEFECGYETNLECEDCKYGPCGGRKDPAAKCNRDR